jgi:hypothetical protein
MIHHFTRGRVVQNGKTLGNVTAQALRFESLRPYCVSFFPVIIFLCPAFLSESFWNERRAHELQSFHSSLDLLVLIIEVLFVLEYIFGDVASMVKILCHPLFGGLAPTVTGQKASVASDVGSNPAFSIQFPLFS